jgi:two-component system sensor histidine kinase MprB
MTLRRRLTIQAAAAIVALVVAFGGVTWVATALHFYAVARADAVALARSTAADAREAPAGLESRLAELRSSADPAMWVSRPPHRWRSPNVPGPVPRPGLHALWSLHPYIAAAARAGPVRVVVAWPLTAFADLLRDLLVVLAMTGVGAGLVGLGLARWATTRILTPVDRITERVAAMVQAGRVEPLAGESGRDEFGRLTTVFNRLLERLERESARHRELLAHAAHELRTPLQVLQGNLDILSDWGGQDPGLQQDSLRQSRLVLDRLTRLVDDLLRLERATSGHPSPTALSLETLGTAVVEDARLLADHLDIVWKGGRAVVWATPWDAERALWAVVDNALKYTPAGGRVEVAVTTDAARGWGGIGVRDTGPGIPLDEQRHVFDRFYRGGDARRTEGFGLGLALAQALLHRDGGRITLHSTPGSGTSVELWWPLAPPA